MLILLFISFLSFFNSPVVADPVEVKITITNLKSANGAVYVAIFKPNNDFPEGDPHSGIKMVPSNGISVTLKTKLPAGEYAFAVFQDLNKNEKIDQNFVGIPTEPYGFSKNFKPKFSAPKFEDCKVVVNSNSNSFDIKLL